MDLRQLRYMEAVARHGSFTSAASELHIAQPSLSHAIRELEAELGLPLFERTSRHVAITDTGRVFLARARTILGEADGLAHEMAEYAGAVRGRIRIGCWYHLEPRLPELLRAFIREHPQVEVTILERPQSETLDLLRCGELDVAVLVTTPETELADLESWLIREEPLVMVVATDDPLAKLDSVSLAALATRLFIGLGPDAALRQWLDTMLARAGVQVRIAVETIEIAGIVAYASRGLGAALLTRSVVAPLDHVAMIPLRDAPLVRIVLAGRGRGHRSPAADGFLRVARRMLVTDGEGAVPAKRSS